MKYCFGVDIGGTTVKLGLFSEAGAIVEKWEIVTRTEDEGSAILPDIAEAINSKLEQHGIEKEQVLGIGVGVPAPVTAEGIVNGSANLGWTYKNAKKELEELTGLKAEFGNDANVAALGEMWKGGGVGYRNMIMVTLGTGVGGGIIAENRLIHGVAGAGGELGHIAVDFSERPFACTCGKKGCLETVASATGIVNLARRYADEYAGDSELKARIDDGQDVSAKDVFDLAKQNDPLALIVIRHFSKYLGIACSHVANMLNPSFIVIGGGVSAAGEFLLEGVRKEYEQLVFPQVRETTHLRLAELGNDAGVIGAASLVLLKD